MKGGKKKKKNQDLNCVNAAVKVIAKMSHGQNL